MCMDAPWQVRTMSNNLRAAVMLIQIWILAASTDIRSYVMTPGVPSALGDSHPIGGGTTMVTSGVAAAPACSLARAELANGLRDTNTHQHA